MSPTVPELRVSKIYHLSEMYKITSQNGWSSAVVRDWQETTSFKQLVTWVVHKPVKRMSGVAWTDHN